MEGPGAELGERAGGSVNLSGWDVCGSLALGVCRAVMRVMGEKQGSRPGVCRLLKAVA